MDQTFYGVLLSEKSRFCDRSLVPIGLVFKMRNGCIQLLTIPLQSKCEMLSGDILQSLASEMRNFSKLIILYPNRPVAES